MIHDVAQESAQIEIYTRTTVAPGWQLWFYAPMHQMNYLNLDIAIAAIRHGFVPWTCIVEVSGLEKGLQCQILDIAGKPIADAFWLNSTDVVHPRKLRSAIEQTRAKLQKEGFALEPWKPRW